MTMTAVQSVATGTNPPRRAAKPPLPRVTASAVWVVGAVGALALWALIYPILIGALQEQDTQQQLFGELRYELSQATAPLGPTTYGRPVALLDSPGAGLHGAVVVEGTGGQDLQKGPGHLKGSVLPGQIGTSVLLGRSVTFGAPFRQVGRLHRGDEITVTTGQGEFRYVVERLRHPGDPNPPALGADQSRLVLGTAAGSGWRAGFAPTSVVYADALLRGKAQPSDGRASQLAVSTAEWPMGTSTQPLLLLVLWLQGLLVSVVAACWLKARWGWMRAWVVAVPVLLAVGIGASGAAAQMLPNTF